MFRFTIRELLLLTVIAALSIAWWLEHRTRSRLSDELKSRNDKLAVLRADLDKGPANFFNMETERLREQLTKQKPLVLFLWPGEHKSVRPQRDPVLEAMQARRELEREADAAGYVIGMGKDGPTLEPKWEGTWNERPAPAGEL
jgi:hypothetical protein